MSGYTKLFSEIVDSSIWEEDPQTFKVWIALLALSDRDGYVRGSVGWLAAKTRVPIKICAASLEKFKRPDPRSRTPDFNGRRIKQLDDGWLILNYIAFRDRLSSDPQAIATRLRVQKHRERVTKRYVTPLRNAVTSPASASASVQVQSCTLISEEKGVQGEGKPTPSETTEATIPSFDEIKQIASTRGIPFPVAKSFFDYYQANNLWLNRHDRPINIGASLTRWASNERQKHYANPKGYNPKNLQKPPPTPGSTPVNGF